MTKVSFNRRGEAILEVMSPEIEMIGYEQITSLASATALTLPTDEAPGEAVISVETAGIRYRADGVNPTASVGMPVAAGERIVIRGIKALAALKIIAQSGSPVVNVAYWR